MRDRLRNLWPEPRELTESFEEEKARLARDHSNIELIEKNEYIRAIRYAGSEDIWVQGTEKDFELYMQATTSLENSLKALQQIAFYLHMGVRIPSDLAELIIEAVLEAIEVAESDPNYGIDNEQAADKCLKAFGKKVGILGGGRRPKANFKLVGYQYESFEQRYCDDLTQEAAKSGISDEDYFAYCDYVSEEASKAARIYIKNKFEISDQQVSRYLSKFEQWRTEQEIQRDQLLLEKNDN